MKLKPVKAAIEQIEKRIQRLRTSIDLKTPLIEKLPKESYYTQHFMKKKLINLLKKSVDEEIQTRQKRMSSQESARTAWTS